MKPTRDHKHNIARACLLFFVSSILWSCKSSEEVESSLGKGEATQSHGIEKLDPQTKLNLGKRVFDLASFDYRAPSTSFRSILYEDLIKLPPELQKKYYLQAPFQDRYGAPVGFEMPREAFPDPSVISSMLSHLEESSLRTWRKPKSSNIVEFFDAFRELSRHLGMWVVASMPHSYYEGPKYYFFWGGHSDNPLLGYALLKSTGYVYRWISPDYKIPQKYKHRGRLRDSVDLFWLQYDIDHPELNEE